MTDTERNTLNARLARAMGYTQSKTTDIIAGRLAGDWVKPNGELYGDEPPDYARDPAASRELVEWVAESRLLWPQFKAILRQQWYETPRGTE